MSEGGNKTDKDHGAKSTQALRWRVFGGIAQVFYPVFRLFGPTVSSKYENTLIAADYRMPAELYHSGSFGVGALVGTVTATLGVLVSLWITGVQGVGDLSVLTVGYVFAGAVLPFLTGLIGCYGLLVYLPTVAANRRRRAINLALPDAIAYMYSLSVSDMSVLLLLQACAESEDTYGEIAREFRRIVHQREYFMTDYQTAIQHVADTTPSDEFSAFLTELLSVIDSGGDIREHLENQKKTEMKQVKRSQEEELDQIELLGQVYMAASLFPILLFIVLVIRALIGQGGTFFLALTVWFVIPLVSAGYVIMISVVSTDQIGTGKIDSSRTEGWESEGISMLGTEIVDSHLPKNPSMFRPIQMREKVHNYQQVIQNPLSSATKRPLWIFPFTGLATAGLLLTLIVTGVATVSLEEYIADHTVQTFIWLLLPVLINGVPLALLYEIRERRRRSITDTLTNDLRKLAQANQTGQPLIEALKATGQTKDSKLAEEFAMLNTKMKYGISLDRSIVEMTNRYAMPRLARTMKLVQKAQETSTHIAEVLKTAADLSETQDDLEEDRITRTGYQVAIVIMMYLVFLVVVMLLELFFQQLASVLSGNPEFLNFQGVNLDVLSTLYLQGLIVQGICSGYIAGYIQTNRHLSGLKYIIGLLLLGFSVWVGAPIITDALGILPQ